jgi:hypothetical protein
MTVLLALVITCVVPTASQGALNIAVGVSATDLSFGQALLTAGIASFLGFDTTVVAYYHNTDRLPLPSVLTTLLFARMFDADHHRIAYWRQHGHGWGRIAKDLGIHPGAFNKMRRGLDWDRVSDDEFERMVTVWYLSQHYGVPQETVYTWQRGGQPLLGILIGLDLGAKSHRSPSDLFKARRSSSSWYMVADKVGVGKGARKHPEKPKGGQAYRGRSASSKGHSEARGNSGGESKGEGKPGHGGGNGKERGGGHGKGPKH